MNKIPFFIGNLLACFVPGNRRRERVRGYINLFFFKPWMKHLIRSVYGERVKTLKLVRQRTLKRAVFIANGKYYIKIFRNVSHQRLCDFVELMDMVSKVISVETPHVFVDKKLPMYVCMKNSGFSIHSFDKDTVLKYQKKIHAQARQILDELQSINVTKIPHNERFVTDMLGHHKHEQPCKGCHQVLGHFDLNPSNFLFDDKLNIQSVIDWDEITIANNPDTDWAIFTRNWEIYSLKG